MTNGCLAKTADVHVLHAIGYSLILIVFPVQLLFLRSGSPRGEERLKKQKVRIKYSQIVSMADPDPWNPNHFLGSGSV